MIPIFLSSAYGFWEPAHRAVVRIAEPMLSTQQITWITALFKTWPSEISDFVKVSFWQDEIVEKYNFKEFSEWHFYEQPIIKNISNIKAKNNFNIINALDDTFKTLYSKNTTDFWALNFAFRNLFHLIADIHNPLHAATYYSQEFKNGDHRGDTYTIENCSYGAPCENLHSLWDSGLLNWQVKVLDTQALKDDFTSNITELSKKFTIDTLGPNSSNLSPLVMHEEAYQIAVDSAYGLIDNHTLMPNYFPVGMEKIDILIASAGLRLGLAIQKFFEIHHFGDPRYDNVSVTTAEIILWTYNILILICITIYSINICRTTDRTSEFTAAQSEKSMLDISII